MARTVKQKKVVMVDVTVFKTDGSITEAQVPKDALLETIAGLTGIKYGYLEPVRLAGGVTMLVDEEGSFKSPLVVNARATEIVHRPDNRPGTPPIYGNVALIKTKHL